MNADNLVISATHLLGNACVHNTLRDLPVNDVSQTHGDIMPLLAAR
jgi:hypothetical protein